MKVLVLLKETTNYHGDDTQTTVMGVYESRDDLLARLGRIEKANRQYPLRELRSDTWRIGPDEDEGFFGNRPVWLRAVEATLHPESREKVG